ncbi:MAG: hypothetical protein EON88_21800 [Brevundimonas sp.]|nr:MAG: hypothetical protein EON88_21800 [Brevundimonas sp.]
MTDLAIAHAIYLAGDSYPTDAQIEREVRARFSGVAASWVGQGDLIEESGAGVLINSIEVRVQQLARLLPEPAAASKAVLFGRSSGARAATAFAFRRPVRAVVCLGYPFRKPNKPEQPGRYKHLATTTVPTLIFQGTDDAYGGRSVVDDYALSDAVRVLFVPADHTMRLDSEGWAFFERETCTFLSELA